MNNKNISMNYSVYKLSAREWLICFGEYIIIISVISYLFYDSLISALALSPFFILFLRRERTNKKEKRQEELNREFLKSLQSIATSLAAGYSPENAFVESAKDIQRLFGDKSIMYTELSYINRQVSMGRRIEEALYDFAKRSSNNRIEDFALIFSVAKQSGGSFAKVIYSCVNIMQTSKQMEDEGKVLIRGKQYEQRIMSIIPVGIILYMRLTSEAFFKVMYHNVIGVGIMTVSLVVYLLSILISEKICKIEI